MIVLNPSDYWVKNILQRNYFLYLICEDKSKADIIQNIHEIAKESKAKYFPETKQIHTLTKKPGSETEISFQGSVKSNPDLSNILGEYNNVLEENDNLFQHEHMHKDENEDYIMLENPKNQTEVIFTDI